MLGRIFAHRRGPRTVVAAPLVRVGEDEPGTTDESAPLAEDEAPEPAPPVEATRSDEVATGEPPEVPEAEVPEAGVPLAEVPRAEMAVDGVAVDEPRTRYCRTCGGRVPLAADGQHCHRGHRLSPAHAERPRGGWLRRLLGRRQ